MRRTLALVLAATSLMAVQPVEPASAVGRARVLRCKKPRACWITAFAFTPAGDEIFYVERFSGEIRRVVLATGTDTRWAKIRGVASVGEQGLLGIALDPGWESGEERVFVYYTQRRPERNKIVRLSKGPDGLERKVLVTIAATTFHDGGVLHFGPDGKLYAVTGDAGVPARSQRVRNPAGKVLRMEEDGSRPSDNPFANGRALSIGHRNSFGFAFDPQTGRLWQTENGPTCDDEINLVHPGRNYGWGGSSACPRTSESGPKPVQPKVRINPLTAPTGAAFCNACGLGAEVDGDLLYGTYLTRKIHALDLNADRDGVTGRRTLLSHPRAVLAVEAAPDGAVYFSDLRAIYRLV
ncbi:MAG TPA: PQQ-dependent sugar dehydrogenase [Actinomycetota bacterium]|jgi:glucose/arabinose dehydrogenase|nr:PQQ-dependent sugar dehydrogenase [Actinomycetota bacterium]